jgi:exodeoxyribonuclease VII large subunit
VSLFDDVPPPAPAPAARPGSRLRPLTVVELDEAADACLRDAIGPVWVTGEISGFRAHRSGHWYFTLGTDGAACVSCAMFSRRNRQTGFRPTDGQSVLVLAKPCVYAPQGRFQLIVELLEPRGAGAAALALEQLKQRLAAEGLFELSRKRRLPLLPRRLGVVTSLDGAALRDVLRVLRRRFPGVEVLVAPAAVQGRNAAEQVAAALGALDRLGRDVLLLVRGGGAREDLAAFDDERVVRAVAACHTPVVTGIGHEIDTTLADLAADLRAPTPSAAAEQVVRERQELLDRLDGLRGRLGRGVGHRTERLRSRLLRATSSRGLGVVPLRTSRQRIHLNELGRRAEDAVTGRLTRQRRRLRALATRLAPRSLAARLARRRQRLERTRSALAAAERAALHRHRVELAGFRSTLRGLSPLEVLGRGYAVVRRGQDGAVVRDAARLSRGEEIDLQFARGRARAEVRTIRPEDEGEGR